MQSQTSSIILAYLKVPLLSPFPGKSKRRLLRPAWASASASCGSTKPFLWSPRPWHRMATSCAAVLSDQVRRQNTLGALVQGVTLESWRLDKSPHPVTNLLLTLICATEASERQCSRDKGV